MLVHTLASAVMPWRSLRLGGLRLAPFGFAAAAGLVTSMALARRCAFRVGLHPEVAWNAGLFVIFSCFATSRLLPVLGNPGIFLGQPTLILGLPSFTLGGVALSALMALIYLRLKHLPFLLMLDSFAAPAALLAVFLEFGHWADRSQTGMPTRLPWGVRVAGAPAPLRVHPVAVYGALLSLGLAVWLWTELPAIASRHARAAAYTPGKVAAYGLIAGGSLGFVLDMLSAPPMAARVPWLEPGQWIALATMLAGAAIWGTSPVATVPVTLPCRNPSSTSSPLHMEVH